MSHREEEEEGGNSTLSSRTGSLRSMSNDQKINNVELRDPSQWLVMSVAYIDP